MARNWWGKADIDTTLVLAILTIFLGSFVQTSIGFGLAVVAAPLLFFLDQNYVPAPVIMAALANCIFTCWRFRAHLTLRGLTPAIVWRVPGSVVGAGVLLVVSESLLAILIAVIIAAGMAANFFRIALPFNQRNLSIAGFLSGVMGTSTSIGGPPMAILMQGQQANVIRSNLAAFYLFSCVISLTILAMTGYLGREELMLGAPLIPAALLGSLLASRFHGFISDNVMRYGCLLLCAISVVAMLLNYLSA